MIFLHQNDRYIAVRMTGNSNNYLGLTVSENYCELQVIPLDIDNKNPLINGKYVLDQVQKGINEFRKNNQKIIYIEKIYFLQSDTPDKIIYQQMTEQILYRIFEQA